MPAERTAALDQRAENPPMLARSIVIQIASKARGRMSRVGTEIQDRDALEEERRASALREALRERKAREQRINRATNRVLAFTLTLSIVAVWVAIRFR